MWPQYLPVPLLWLLNSEVNHLFGLLSSNFVKSLPMFQRVGQLDLRLKPPDQWAKTNFFSLWVNFLRYSTTIVINLLIRIFLAHILHDANDRKNAYKYYVLSPKPRIKLMVWHMCQIYCRSPWLDFVLQLNYLFWRKARLPTWFC